MLFCGSETRHARKFDCPGWKHVCGKCGYKGHFEQFCRKNPQLQRQHQSKNVQEVHICRKGTTKQKAKDMVMAEKNSNLSLLGQVQNQMIANQ